jgi:hypothetical protein
VSDLPITFRLRSQEDLPALGKFLRAQRRRAGLALAGDAAPYLGVGVRLLTQLESGTRGKRGVTIGKLLDVLRGLGFELIIQPRSMDTPIESLGVGAGRESRAVTRPARNAATPRKRRPPAEPRKPSPHAPKRRKGSALSVR